MLQAGLVFSYLGGNKFKLISSFEIFKFELPLQVIYTTNLHILISQLNLSIEINFIK